MSDENQIVQEVTGMTNKETWAHIQNSLLSAGWRGAAYRQERARLWELVKTKRAAHPKDPTP